MAGNALASDADDAFVVDVTGPTVDIVDITPDPREASVGLVTIAFSEAVTGLDIADFSLTLDGSVVDLSELTVTPVSPTEYTVDFSTVAQAGGTYVLTITAQDSGVQDLANNPLTEDASDSWEIVVQIATLSESGGSTVVSEAGVADWYTLVLNLAPTDTVTITLDSSLPGEFEPLPTLTFTPADFDVPQTVSLSVLDDAVAEGIEVARIGHEVSSNDPRFDGAAIDTVMLTIIDNEVGDQFTRPDGELGPDWNTVTGTFILSDTEAVGADPSEPALALNVQSDTVETDGICAEADVDLTTTLGHCGVVLRASDDGLNLYLGAIAFDGSFTTAHIWKRVEGNWSPLLITGIDGNPRAGRIEFEILQSTLVLRLDGSVIGSAGDTEIAEAGYAGIRSTNGITYDNVLIEPIPLPTVTVPYDTSFELEDGPLPSEWQPLSGSFAVSGNVARTETGGTAVLNTADVLDNTIVEACVDLGTGSNSHMGLVARWSGPHEQNMYLGSIVRQDASVYGDIWVNQNGEWTQLAHQLISTGGDGQGRLRFHTHGDQLQLSLNQTVVARATDGRIVESGQVGIRGSAGQTIDNFHVEMSTEAPSNEVGGLVVLAGSFTETSAGELTANLYKSVAVDQKAAVVTDMTISAEVALPANGLSAVGLLARYTGPGDDNYYWGTLVREEDGDLSLRVYSCVNGVTVLLGSTAASASSGVLTFSSIGQTLCLSLGSEELTITDDVISTAGYAGLRGFSGSTYKQITVS